MLWLFLCIAVALIWSFSAFIDNYITDVIFKGKKPQSMKIFNGISYLFFALIIPLAFGVKSIAIDHIILLLLSGIASSVASIPYYLALREEESTTAAVFYQLIPVIYLFSDWLIFGEAITSLQLIAFVIILIAPAIIIFTRKRPRSRRIEFNAALLFTLYACISALSGILSTRIGEKYDFPSVFFYFLVGRGLSDVILFATHSDWQQRMKFIWQRKKWQFLFAEGTNQIICIIAEFLSRYALIIGVASLISVTYNVLELIFTFALGIILSIIWPKFGREKLNRHVVIAHFIATILATIGIILIR